MAADRLRSLFMAGSALALITASGQAVYAQSASTTQLETIAVQGEGEEAASVVSDTPLATETTAEDIERKQITSIDDLGRTTEPGVSYNSDNGSVNIRGLDGARVLTTIDSIRIPFLQDGARDASGGIASFDFNSLEALDIVRGADSSRGGGGALGGAMVLSTLEPEDLIREGRTWGGFLRSTYDSSDDSYGGFAGIAARMGLTSVLFQGGYKTGHEEKSNGDVGGYGTSRTEANPADYDENNLLFKLRQGTETGHTFGLTAERYDIDQDTDLQSEQSVGGNYRPGNWWGEEGTRRERLSLDYKFEAFDDDAWVDHADAVVYWQHLTRKAGTNGYRYTSVIGEYERLSKLTNESYGISANADKSVDIGDQTHTFTFGFDVATGTTSQYAFGVDSCVSSAFPPCSFLHANQSDMPDVDSTQAGFFIDDEIAFGDTGFSLTPGLRFDWYDHRPQDTAAYQENPNYTGLPASQNDSQLSPKLLAKYAATSNLDLFAQYAMAFRAPTPTELYLDYGAPGTYLSVGNPDLKPETSHGFEIGATYDDGSFRARVTGFYNRYKNFIDTRNLSDDEQIAIGITPGTYPYFVEQSFNRANVRIYGAEVNLLKEFENGFNVHGALSYANGTDLDTGERLGSVAPLKGIVGVGYATETWGADVSLIAQAAVSEDSTANYKAPSYGVVDVTAWWSPEQVEGLTLQAGVYNLFDETYYDSVSLRNVNITQPDAYYSEPGRTFKLSATKRF